MTLFSKQIIAGADDAGARPIAGQLIPPSFLNNQTVSQLGEAISLPSGQIDQDVTARFTNVTVAQGATINSATMTYIPSASGQSQASNIDLFIVAHDVDNSSQIIDLTDYQARILVVTALVLYNTGPVFWVGGVPQVSSDIASIIQAIVNRPGWVSGNAINIFTRNNDASNGDREGRVEMFESNPANSMQLDIDFTVIGVPPPTVSFLSPASGLEAGGTVVTITGADFVSGATVTFGGTPATLVNFIDSTTLEATTPAKPAGAVDVVVTNPDAQFGTFQDGYTYVSGVIVASGFQDAGQQGTQVVLVDLSADFIGSGVVVGGTLNNDTDAPATGPVDLITKHTLTAILTAGAVNLWVPGDAYTVFSPPVGFQFPLTFPETF